MSDKKLTNKKLIQFRRKEMVKELGLFDEHERTHTGTAVLRKKQASGQYENALDMPSRKATAEEIKDAVMQALVLASVESLPIGIACARVAARYGLQHNQVDSLKDEVLSYLEDTARRVKIELDSSK